MKTVCSNLDEFKRSLRCDPANLPVVESVLRNLWLPIGQTDVDFLAGQTEVGASAGVDFFADPGSGRESPGTFSRGPGLVRAGLRFRTDFVLDAVCVMLHCEPSGWAIDGNKITSQVAIDALNQLPRSPLNSWDGACLGRGQGLFRCNAQMEHGTPTWRAAHWALQAYRLAMQCPSSPGVHEIMNERLVDLGNCCLGTDYQGYGASRASEIYFIRALNTKLRALRRDADWPIVDGLEGPTTHSYDPGYFLPFNESEDYVSGSCLDFPVRMSVAREAYGSPKSSPIAYKWFRLPMPRIIHHDEDIEILLQVDPNDKLFWQRMIHEMVAHICLSPIPGIANHTVNLFNGASIVVNDVSYSRFPSGLLRFGLGLRGFMLDANFCVGIKDRFNAMTLEEFRSTDCGIGRVVGPHSVIGSGPQIDAEQLIA